MAKTGYDYHLAFLKEQGHKLLDEYVSLDYVDRDSKGYAYKKLAKKLKAKDFRKAHFGAMATEGEVVAAINRLEAMIAKRKNKIERGLVRNDVVAPNVMELQKMASQLNPHL